MSRYSVLIDLNTTGIEELNKVERQIQQIQAQGNKPINLKIDVDGNIKNISSMFDNIEKQATQSGKNINKALQKGMRGFTFNSKDPYFSEFFKRLEADQKNIENISRNYKVDPKDAKQAYNAYGREVEKQEKELARHTQKIAQEQNRNLAAIQRRTNSGEFELRTAKMNAFEAKYDGQNNGSLNRVKNTIKEIKLLQKELQTGIYESGDQKGLQIVADDQIAKMNQLDTAIDKLSNGMKEVGVTMSKSVDSNIIQRSIDSIDTYMSKNTRALKDYQGVLQDIQNQFRNAKTQDDYISANNNLKNIQAEISAKGLTGNSFTHEIGRAFKQISEFVGVYGILQNVAYEIPTQMVQAVKDVNAAQIELTKVSTAPTSELSAYWDEAAVSAKKYGATISDVISSTADWQRLGYDFEASKKLSDATTLMQKVGDNMTQESASKGIISTLSGFKMDADEVTKIVDVANEIANTQPIDTAGIFEGLERSASSMSAANNSLEETVALISAANSVVQDPASIGTAFKTISMRLRGAKSELESASLDTEGMAESTAKLREEIMALSGVDIMLNDSTFKDTYQILDELSQKWEDLSDIQQASLTEIVAGKHQGNVMSALMENFDIARNALDTALNDSEGSAERELENWNQGIEASLAHFQAQFQQFSTSAISSDFFKGFVDGGTEALNILTQIVDTFGILAPLTGAIMTKTGKGKRNATLYKIKQN